MAKQKRAQPDTDLLGRLWRDVVLAVRLMFDRRVSGSVKMIPLLALLYILSPLDFIPDVLLPVGVLDDMGVFVMGLQLFIFNAPRDIVNSYRGLREPEVRPEWDEYYTPRRGEAPRIIEGQYEVLDEGWDDYSQEQS